MTILDLDNYRSNFPYFRQYRKIEFEKNPNATVKQVDLDITTKRQKRQ